MTDFVLTLVAGATLILVVGFWLQRRFQLGRGLAGLIPAALAVAFYIGYAAVRWPGAEVVALHVAVYLVSGFVAAVAGQIGRHWAPTLLVGLFLLLVVADLGFVLISEHGVPRAPWSAEDARPAVSSAFPGTTLHDFQKRREGYDAYRGARELQRERGWQVRKGWLGVARAGEPATFQVVPRDRDGNPLTGLRASGRFLRPADGRLDQAFEMAEVEPGVYRVQLTLPAAGEWDLVLELERDEAWHEVRARTRVAPSERG